MSMEVRFTIAFFGAPYIALWGSFLTIIDTVRGAGTL
ncbi:MAG: hypothetical protein UY34_C0006G0010 [Parcubacteria group bacterium GW2011_GWA2_48_9]|nr:MAG: hypothetical protein UY34_C0006G0010 [Parcubacteria group bacterium GW2011_GWA2_48_9]